MSTIPLPIEDLQQLARSVGLDVVGICDLAQVKRQQGRLRLWQQSGHAGEMKYMMRAPELLTASEHLLSSTRSIVSCTLNYSQDAHPERTSGSGRVARYAWGRDYHLIIPVLLKKLVTAVEQHIGRSLSSRVFSDALPFLERAGAHSAGLGFVGKNTMLIRKGVGSFFFIAEVLWDLEIEQQHSIIPEENSCGSCTRCLTNCPTEAFVEPFVLHAPRCISYLSIEKRGAHTPEERRSLGEWIFGCDICQDVCPFNHRTIKQPEPPAQESLSSRHGVGPLLDLGDVLRIRSNREYELRFADTPLLRPGKVGLQRNALAVAANTGAAQLIPEIAEMAEHSASPILRRTALWSLYQLEQLNRGAQSEELSRIRNKLLADPEAEVRSEARDLDSR